MARKTSQGSVASIPSDPAESDSQTSGAEEITRCICGHQEFVQNSRTKALNAIPGLYVQCERCNVWQHGFCMGFQQEEDIPNEYYCELCEPTFHRISQRQGVLLSKYRPVGASKGSSSTGSTNHSTPEKGSSNAVSDDDSTPPLRKESGGSRSARNSTSTTESKTSPSVTSSRRSSRSSRSSAESAGEDTRPKSSEPELNRTSSRSRNGSRDGSVDVPNKQLPDEKAIGAESEIPAEIQPEALSDVKLKSKSPPLLNAVTEETKEATGEAPANNELKHEETPSSDLNTSSNSLEANQSHNSESVILDDAEEKSAEEKSVEEQKPEAESRDDAKDSKRKRSRSADTDFLRNRKRRSREEEILQRVLEESAREARELESRRRTEEGGSPVVEEKIIASEDAPDSIDAPQTSDEASLLNSRVRRPRRAAAIYERNLQRNIEADESSEEKIETPPHTVPVPVEPRPSRDRTSNGHKPLAPAPPSPTDGLSVASRSRRNGRVGRGSAIGSGTSPSGSALSRRSGGSVRRAKPRIPSQRSTLDEMRRRVSTILDFSSRTQDELVDDQKVHISALQASVSSKEESSRFEQLLAMSQDNLTYLEDLTSQLLKWEEQFGVTGSP